MEGPAAKQGVSDEECLLTSPEERGDHPPYWMHATEDTTTAETERPYPSKNQSYKLLESLVEIDIDFYLKMKPWVPDELPGWLVDIQPETSDREQSHTNTGNT